MHVCVHAFSPRFANAKLMASELNMPFAPHSAEQWNGTPTSEENLKEGLMGSFAGGVPQERFALETCHLLESQVLRFCLVFMSLSFPPEEGLPHCWHMNEHLKMGRGL